MTLEISPVDRPQVGRRKSAQRSRIGNGSTLLGSKVDGRSLWCRRLRENINDLIADKGGADNTSAAERCLIRRAGTLIVELERLEIKFALAGEASERDLDLYIRGSGGLRRLLELIGLGRRAKDVTP